EDLVDAVFREFVEERFGAVVAVGVGGENEAPGIVEEDVIDAPGVDAAGGEGGFGLFGFAEAFDDFGKEAGEIPVAAFAEAVELVGETVNFAEGEAGIGPGTEDDASAGGSEIDGGDVGGFHGEWLVLGLWKKGLKPSL